MMAETPGNRIKRMKMRSMRRGIKEMDIVMSAYAERRLDGMSAEELDLYEALLGEADQDLLLWLTGRATPPERFAAMIEEMSRVLEK